MADNQSESHPPNKRKATRYVSSACDFCKQRHLRCDGQETCFQCQRRQQACTYTQKNIKRGPKPKKRPKKESPSSPQENISIPLGTGTSKMFQEPKPSFSMTPQPTSAFYSPTLENVSVLFTGFLEKVAPFLPSHGPLVGQVALEVWKNVISSIDYRKFEYLVDCFYYLVVLACGAKATTNDSLAMDFATKADEISNLLFFYPSSIQPELYAPFADALVSSLLMFGVFKIEVRDFNGARVCFAQGYNILNMNIGDVSPAVAYRLFSHLAGMSRSTKDMLHWVSNARALGSGAATPINRVILSLLFCSPCMLRDPKNRPIPSELVIPSPKDLVEDDLQLFGNMLEEFKNAEDIIKEFDQTAKQSAANGNFFPYDQMICCKLIIEGCRALVLAQRGEPENAIKSAEKCIGHSKDLQTRIVYWALPLSLSYALNVCIALNNQSLFHDGIVIVEQFASYFPFLPPIIHQLTSQFISNIPTHEIHPPEHSNFENQANSNYFGQIIQQQHYLAQPTSFGHNIINQPSFPLQEQKNDAKVDDPLIKRENLRNAGTRSQIQPYAIDPAAPQPLPINPPLLNLMPLMLPTDPLLSQTQATQSQSIQSQSHPQPLILSQVLSHPMVSPNITQHLPHNLGANIPLQNLSLTQLQNSIPLSHNFQQNLQQNFPQNIQQSIQNLQNQFLSQNTSNLMPEPLNSQPQPLQSNDEHQESKISIRNSKNLTRELDTESQYAHQPESINENYQFSESNQILNEQRV